jgi:hypothetical protein
MQEITFTQKEVMIFTVTITFDWVVERITTHLSPPKTLRMKKRWRVVY